MKNLTQLLRPAALLGAIAVALAGAPCLAAETAAWESGEFHAVVSGTSTLHGWTVESRSASGDYRTSGSGGGTLRLAAKSLSGSQSGLNDRMYAALKADAHPTIVFEATEVKLPATLAGTTDVPVRGRLTLAGTTRELALTCRASMTAAGELVLEADVPLRMTDHGIKPPTFMGMIKTGDAVNVRIRWLLRPAKTAADAVARR